MSQTLTACMAGTAAALFVATCLALRYWTRQRHQTMNDNVPGIGGDATLQRRSSSSGAEHPSMDVD